MTARGKRWRPRPQASLPAASLAEAVDAAQAALRLAPRGRHRLSRRERPSSHHALWRHEAVMPLAALIYAASQDERRTHSTQWLVDAVEPMLGTDGHDAWTKATHAVRHLDARAAAWVNRCARMDERQRTTVAEVMLDAVRHCGIR